MFIKPGDQRHFLKTFFFQKDLLHFVFSFRIKNESSGYTITRLVLSQD